MTVALRGPLQEARKKHTSNTRHVSTMPSFDDDVKKYTGDSQVINKIEEVKNLFINRKDSELGKPEYHDHELDRRLKDHQSIRLGIRDIVIVYKSRNRGDHIVFHRIDSHDDVYDPEYEAKERERQKQRYRRKN